MKTELGKNLKALLDKMSQEEFDKQWNDIVALGLRGPSFDDYLAYSAQLTNLTSLEYTFDVLETSKEFQETKYPLSPAA